MPTLNQKRAILKIAEKLGKGERIILGQILIDSGYSKSVALSPDKVTNSLGWQELWQKNFPADRIQSLLDRMVKDYEGADKIEDKRTYLNLIEFLAKATPNAMPKEAIDVDLRLKRENLIEA